MKKILILSFVLFVFSSGISQENVIEIPKFNDEYSKTVKLLEKGELNIDYKLFRENFLKSEQFRIALTKSDKVIELTKKVYSLMEGKDYENIIFNLKKILSIDYTNLRAHKILRQSYSLKGDTLNSKKYKTIQFGLLKSIVETGDGKSCQSAWKVIQISEEYFILDMLDANFKKQSIDYDGGICDRMEVLIDNKEKVYYFDVEDLLLAKQNLKKRI